MRVLPQLFNGIGQIDASYQVPEASVSSYNLQIDCRGMEMFFTKCARIVAILGLLGAIAQIAMGFQYAQIGLEEQAKAGLSSAKHFDRGAYMLLFSFALGTLVEISFNIRKAITKDAA